MPKPSAGKTAVSLGAGSFQGRARGWRRLFTWERGLGAVGFGLAVASGSFASYMISDSGRQPHFSGAEYLTVFAKLTPSGHGSNRDGGEPDDLATASVGRDAAPGSSDGADKSASTRVDVVGSISAAPAMVRNYVLRSVSRGTALIDSPEGLREVRRGAILPNAGLVTAIEQREGKWVVVTSQGIIREPRR
ncbi:hypothetical protein SAMN05519104_3448 [Rhizobiales bacterium GAS188]|nr:hypothetical protein SAMN05519104_3448 [Rhizobiales bacterium GAS188]